MVNGDAERRTDCILTAVSLADGILFLVLAVEVVLEFVHNLLGKFRQTVLLDQRKHCSLDRCKRSRYAEHRAGLAVFELFLLVRVAEHCKYHTVHTYGGFYYIRGICAVLFRIEILDFPARIPLVVAEVEVGTAVYALEFLESEREVKFYVGGGICIVGEFLVVVETVVLRTHTKVDVPLHTLLLPFCKPVEFRSRLDEELHLHLLELPHPEYELTCDNLVAECLSYLSDTERNLHSSGLLHVKIVHENALGGLRTQINDVGRVCRATHRSLEHKVELPYVGPVAGSADRTYYVAVYYYLTVLGKIACGLGGHIALVHLIISRLLAKHVGVGCAELLLVERLAELLAALLNLLVDFFLNLSEIVLDEHVGTVTLLRVLVVNERIVECAHVTGSLPDARVHENAGIDAHNVFVEAGHRLPPVLLYVVLEFHSHLTIIVNGCQSVIYFAGRENKPIFLAMGYQYLEKFILCHNANLIFYKCTKIRSIFAHYEHNKTSIVNILSVAVSDKLLWPGN